MTQDDAEIIGKGVKDMYGTPMGRVVGTVTDIDGSIQSVGVDCGSHGLRQVQYEQLVVQGDSVVFIPRWRLDSQRLIREKQLTLRRLRALIDIVSENDDMKADAEIIHEKYRSRLSALGEAEAEIKARLDSRLAELEEEAKSAKMLVFDAKVQCKSDEITAAAFETVRSCAGAVVERVSHEQAEIASVRGRIADLGLEAQEMAAPRQNIQESAVSYLESPGPKAQDVLPEAPAEPAAPAVRAEQRAPAFPEPPQAEPQGEGDWLARMQAQ